MTLLEALDVPDPRSRASTSPTDSPRVAASSAAPVPVIPPPTTSTSSSPEVSASSARRRAAGSRAPLATVEERPEGGVEGAVTAVDGVVELPQLRVGLHRLAARPRHRRARLGDAAVQPRAGGGEHRGAAGGRLDGVGP